MFLLVIKVNQGDHGSKERKWRSASQKTHASGGEPLLSQLCPPATPALPAGPGRKLQPRLRGRCRAQQGSHSPPRWPFLMAFPRPGLRWNIIPPPTDGIPTEQPCCPLPSHPSSHHSPCVLYEARWPRSEMPCALVLLLCPSAGNVSSRGQAAFNVAIFPGGQEPWEGASVNMAQGRRSWLSPTLRPVSRPPHRAGAASLRGQFPASCTGSHEGSEDRHWLRSHCQESPGI